MSKAKAQPTEVTYTQGNILNTKTGDLQTIAALLYMCTSEQARFLATKATIAHHECNKNLWRVCFMHSVAKELYIDCVKFTFRDDSVISLNLY